MAADTKISVLVLVHNEARYLPKFHDGLLHELKKQDVPFEIVYVENGSDDESLTTLHGLQRADADIAKVVELRRHFSRGLVLAAGIQHCTGERVVCLPATGCVPASAWPRLLERLADVDFVHGRQPDRSRPLACCLAGWLHNHILSPIAGVHLHDMYCEAFAARKEVLEQILPVPTAMEHFLGLAARRQGYEVEEVLLPCNDFVDDSGSFPGHCFQGVFDVLFVLRAAAWLYGPLRAFAVVGVLFLLLAALAGVGALVHYLFYGLVDNNGTLLCLEIALGLVGLSVMAMLLGTAAEASRSVVRPNPEDCIKSSDDA